MPAQEQTPLGQEWRAARNLAYYLTPDRFLPVLFQVAIWCYVLIAVLSFFGSPVDLFDESIPLVHATLIQKGQVPNIDFYSFYPPLGSYLYAAVFSLVGKSIISARLIGVFLYIAVLCLAAAFFRVQFPRWFTLVPGCVLLMALSIGGGLDVPGWPGLALSLVAFLTYHLAQTLSRNRIAVTAISGLLTGAAILYRVNFGGYVAISIAVDILLRWWPESGQRFTRERLRSAMASAVAYGAPLAVVFFGFCFLVYGQGTGRAISEFVINTQKFMLLRGFIKLRYSSESACWVMLPCTWFFFHMLRGSRALPLKAFVPAAFALANFLLVIAWANRPSIAWTAFLLEIASVLFLHLFIYRLRPAELSILLLFCGQLHYCLSRWDFYHSRWFLVIFVLLLPFQIFKEQEEIAVPPMAPAPPMGTPFAVLFALIVIVSVAIEWRPRGPFVRNGLELLSLRIHNPRVPDSDLVFSSPVRAWGTVYSDPDEIAALRFLRAHTGPNEPIFSGVGDHSRIYYNVLRNYWLAGRPIGVRTFQLETRSATEAPVQSEIIADLVRNKVRWLILYRAKLPSDPTFAEEDYQGSKLLDDYIRTHFRDVAQFGNYSILNPIDSLDLTQQ